MNKKYLLLILLSIFCLSCTKKNKEIALPLAPVLTAYSEEKNIPYYIDTIGHFAPFNTVTIQAQVQGELTGLYFTEGQKVNEGDLLFTIDKDPYQAILDKAVATLRQNEALLAYNKNRVDRYSQLVKDDFVSKLDYEDYVSQMQTYEAIINENLAEIESAEINVNFCTLRAPLTGVTGKRLVDVGNIITDVGSKLLVINQISPIFVDFSIPERFFDLVYQKQLEAPLDIELFVPNTSLKAVAKLQMLDNTINPNTGMIALRGILPNEENRFWPQQFIRIRLIVDTLYNSIMVPPSAVVPSADSEIVWFVDEKGEADFVKVEPGEEYENQVRIKKGLKKGVQVITSGQLGLFKGRKVIVKNDKETENI